MEREEHLWPGGPAFFYNDALFRPSTDSFLLAHFTRVRRGERVCDLGAGTGLLSVLLLARQSELTVWAVELLAEGCELIHRAAEQNGWEDRLIPHQADLRQLAALPRQRFDAVICNPPYFPDGSGQVSPAPERRMARSETTASLEDVCRAASALLGTGGRFSLVMRTERMAELFVLCRRFALEPKRLRTVHHVAGAAPSLFLLECRKDGRPGLTAEPPLVLKHGDGTDTAEYDRIYFR